MAKKESDPAIALREVQRLDRLVLAAYMRLQRDPDSKTDRALWLSLASEADIAHRYFIQTMRAGADFPIL